MEAETLRVGFGLDPVLHRLHLRGLEEVFTREDEGELFSRGVLLEHQIFVVDGFGELPAPPRHLLRLELVPVQELHRARPLRLLRGEHAVPIHAVLVRALFLPVELVPPPRDEDGLLRNRLLRRRVHFVKEVKPARGRLPHVQAQGIRFSEGREDRGERLLIFPGRELRAVDVGEPLAAALAAFLFLHPAADLEEHPRAVLPRGEVAVVRHAAHAVLLREPVVEHVQGRAEHVAVFFRVRGERALHAVVFVVPE